MVNASSKVATLLLLSAFVYSPRGFSQCAPQPGERVVESFSSLATVGGLEYPSGMELMLDEHGTSVKAVLRDYYGEPTVEEIKLVGSIREKEFDGATVCEVRLTGMSKRGAVRIRAAITRGDLQGSIERHLGRGTFINRISLKRRLPVETLTTSG